MACASPTEETLPQQMIVPDTIQEISSEIEKEIEEGGNFNNVDKGFLLGKINFSQDNRFVKLRSNCTKEIYLLREVEDAFVRMAKAAEADGVRLTVLSGGRSFNHQRSIWVRKWESAEGSDSLKAWEILRFSSMPGTSRHHWGTDIDLNSLENDFFKEGEGLKIYSWLMMHAVEFGFHQPYSDKAEKGRKGYEMEKWHWSYLPVSEILLQVYNEKITYQDIQGFPGSEIAKKLRMIEWYVNGVDLP